MPLYLKWMDTVDVQAKPQTAMLLASLQPFIAYVMEDRERTERWFEFVSTPTSTFSSVISVMLNNKDVFDKAREDKAFLLQMIQVLCDSSHPDRLGEVVSLLQRLRPSSEADEAAFLRQCFSMGEQIAPSKRTFYWLALGDLVVQSRIEHRVRLTELADKIVQQTPDELKSDVIEIMARRRAWITRIDSVATQDWMIKSATNATDKSFVATCRLFLQNPKWKQRLLADEYFDDFMERGQKLPNDEAGPFWSSMLLDRDITQRLIDKKQLVAILRFARKIDDPALKNVVSRALTSNPIVVPYLIQSKAFAELEALTTEVTDPVGHAVLVANLMCEPTAVDYLIKQGRIEMLVSFASPEWDVQQQEAFVNRVIQSSTYLDALVANQRVGDLLDWLAKNEAFQNRTGVVVVLLSHSEVIDWLLEKDRFVGLIDGLVERPNRDDRSRFSQIVRTKETVDALVKTERLGAFLKAAVASESPNQAANKLQQLILSGLAKACVESGNTETLLAQMQQLTERWSDNERELVLNTLIGQFSTGFFRNHEEFVTESEAIIAFVVKQSSKLQARYLPSLLLNSERLRRLKVENKLGNIVKQIEAITDDQSRHRMIEVILGQVFIRDLITEGHLDSIVSWVKQAPDDATRQRWLSMLTRIAGYDILQRAGYGAAVLLILENDAPGFLNSKIQMIESLVATRQNIDKLKREGNWKTLIDHCLKSQHRQRCLLALLSSSYACREMHPTEQLRPWVAELIDSATISRSDPIMASVCQRTWLLEPAVEAGYRTRFWNTKRRFPIRGPIIIRRVALFG
ncbi:MAG: hypothetical protein R3C05_02725 [Pirellulaceae bacterium]